MQEFDLVIIGGGPGGYVAAMRASQLGMKIAIVEKEHLGGICLNWGCIPTKALLKAAEIYHTIENAKEFGIIVEKPKIDFKALINRSREVAKKLTGGVSHLMKKNNITVINGFGKLLGNSKIEVLENTGKKTELKAKHIIIATGARAKELPNLKADGKNIWSYKEAMVPTDLPKSILVIGSGAIGVEFASFYNMLGVDVTILEIAPRILMAEDAEIAQVALKAFEKRGIKILISSEIAELKNNKDNVQVKIKDSKGTISTITVEKIISAVGITPNVENIGLEKTKVQLEKNHIKTDEYLRTNEPNVYAIGDVTKGPWLAHKASHEGIVCVEKIAGIKNVHPIKRENIPGCTYCYPQIASIGLTEAKAKEQGYKIKVGRFPLAANGKAIAVGETQGLVKTIFDEKTGELLGAHMIGAEVTEMIQGFSIAKTSECTEAELMATIFPHPTISEVMPESVLDAFGRVLHF
jgi:dihydrolipoamide dehydrogenase